MDSSAWRSNFDEDAIGVVPLGDGQRVRQDDRVCEQAVAILRLADVGPSKLNAMRSRRRVSHDSD